MGRAETVVAISAAKSTKYAKVRQGVHHPNHLGLVQSLGGIDDWCRSRMKETETKIARILVGYLKMMMCRLQHF